MTDITYYELGALAPIDKKSNRPVTLDDLHRRAWKLYRGEKVADPVGERPFVFRAERYGARWLFTVRSSSPFPGAECRSLAIEEDMSLALDMMVQPHERIEDEESGSKSRITGLPREQWDDYAAHLLGRCGLVIDHVPEIHYVGGFRFSRRISAICQVANATAAVRVFDLDSFAASYLGGIGRRRGYGMGMLQIAPGSAIQDVAA